MLDLECVATFLAVAACNGFREAAKRTGLSQPAVSQHVKRLERSLNVSLIERHHGGSKLSIDGRAFLPFAQNLVSTSERAQALFRNDSIVVGASSNAGIYLLQPYLKAFQDLGRYAVQLVIGSNTDMAARLERFEIDVAVMEWWDDRPGFVAQPWRSEELVLIVPANHPWSQLARIKRGQLHGQQMLGGEPGSGTGRLMQQYFGEATRSIGVSMQLGSTEAVKRAVEAGLGISLVMAAAVEQECRDGRLCMIALEGEPPRKNIVVVRRYTEPHHQPPAQVFGDFLLKKAAAA